MSEIQQGTTLIVVVAQSKIICVYLNGERIAGRKPSPLDGAVYLEKVISKDSILEAIGALTQTRLTKRAPDVCPSCAGAKQVIGEDGTVWVCGICGGTGKRG